MKLDIKNLTGTLPSRDKYRIIFTDTLDSISNRRIISIRREVYDVFTEQYYLDNVISKSYEKKEQYTQTLKEALLKAENEFGIQLLKSTKKIAI